MSFDIHVYFHNDHPDHEVERKLDLILERINAMAHTLDETIAAITTEDTKIDSFIALFNGLESQLADILAGTVVPPAVQTKIDAMFDQATASAGKIDAAVAANTPVTPPVVPTS
jgi:hypothetical protein